MFGKVFSGFLIGCSLYSGCFADNCVDPKDSYDGYDNKIVENAKIRKTDFYVMSYTWAGNHCDTKGRNNKPGDKDYLQCGSGQNFGYILHGLWPQGSFANPKDYPRACEGDQPKIDRKVLEKFLCMTPSFWLLQHEYEFHGTCMHDEALEDPSVYFGKALELHGKHKLPTKQITDEKVGKKWFAENNPHLKKNSVYLDKQSKEWHICYDLNFSSIECPSGSAKNGYSASSVSADKKCKVKGNISNNKNKYYFTADHPDYKTVVISANKGERCFSTESEAKKEGWKRAPR